MGAPTYPRDIVTIDGWGRIHEGHSLDPATLRDDLREKMRDGAPGQEPAINEVYLKHTSRIMWCERLDGAGCDLNGEWHGHWSEVMPSPGSEFTLVHWHAS